jgi:ribosomal protein S18 acetylase RimI-like enzyme
MAMNNRITNNAITFRRARRSEAGALRELHACSMRALSHGFYENEVIEAFLAHVDTLDEGLIDAGNYLTAHLDGMLAGCGGWTADEPSYAPHLGAERPHDARARATVRSVYVHPDFAGHSIARTLMGLIESDIARAGLETAVLEATLNAIPFYRRLGYRGDKPVVFRLPQDRVFVALSMEKETRSARMLIPSN